MRASKFLTAASVMAAGVCAAWPFRQPAGKLQLPPLASTPLDLTLRAHDVPLTAATASSQSPATDLVPARTVVTVSNSVGNLLLEQFARPPELPVSFRSPVETSDSPLTPLAVAPPSGHVLDERPRPHSYILRDGDTLENLAERFLGSRTLAADLFEANRPQLTRPDLLPVGVTIIIPPRRPISESAELAER